MRQHPVTNQVLTRMLSAKRLAYCPLPLSLYSLRRARELIKAFITNEKRGNSGVVYQSGLEYVLATAVRAEDQSR